VADADPPALPRLLERAADLPAGQWDACAGEANPFARHAFVTALEDSGSASPRTGWTPAHLVLDGADGRAAAILPAWAKTHSQGEYVFDHGWADAYERAGGGYYPKLQICSPFTPATGPRLLLSDAALARPLIAAAEALTRANHFSSAHATFLEPDQAEAFEAAGWLIRHDLQFHWTNQGYATFEDFLGALSSRKRKAIRKERSEALPQGLRTVHLTGGDLREAHWDAFWAFYQDTGARKWGRPYLTRRFFSLVGERMPERILLMLALRGDTPVAGALNFIGAYTLYGRYWGCVEDVPFLHFELCYHQAVEWAIAHGLKRVEAGAQGEHKLARGYLPVTTTSAHYLAHPGLRTAVARYLEQERAAIAQHAEALSEAGPFRRETCD
jgi:predicted N-acyltransferase